MSKAELIAAASVSASAGPPADISFNSNFGFKTAARSSAGAYNLELDDKHERHKIVVNATLNNQIVGEIEASLPSEGNVQVLTFDVDGNPIDSPFFITVYKID